MKLFKIGKGKTYHKRKSFEILLGNYETRTKDYYVDKITTLDTAVTNKYAVGYSFLISRYINKVNL